MKRFQTIKSEIDNKRPKIYPNYKPLSSFKKLSNLKQELKNISQVILKNMEDGVDSMNLDLDSELFECHRNIIQNKGVLDEQRKEMSELIATELDQKYTRDTALCEEDVTNYIEIKFNVSPELLSENSQILYEELLNDGWDIEHNREDGSGWEKGYDIRCNYPIRISRKPYDW